MIIKDMLIYFVAKKKSEDYLLPFKIFEIEFTF